MKNVIRFFLSTFLVFVLISCAQIGNAENKGELNVSADGILKSLYRTGAGETVPKSDPLSVSVKLTGISSQEITKDLDIKDIGTPASKFGFTAIPLGGPLYISCEVRTKNEKNTILYEGSVTKNDIIAGQNFVRLSLDSRNRYLVWTLSDDPSADFPVYRMYENLSGNLDIMSSLVGELNSNVSSFYLDKNKNLYTIEDNRQETFVKKYSYISPDKPEILYKLSNNPDSPNSSVLLTCVASDGNNVYVGYEDSNNALFNEIRKIKDINTLETAATDLKQTPEKIEFASNGDMYVLQRSAYGVVNKFTNNNGVYNGAGNFEILELLETGPDGYPPDKFRVTDFQIQGNYIYLLVVEEGGMEGRKSNPFSGGVIPIDISGPSPVVKSIVGYDKTCKYQSLEKEEISNNIFYSPSKFVSREEGKLDIADDGFYELYKPGYIKADRNVNRVVTLSLDNPASPSIEKNIMTTGITFGNEQEEVQFVFNPPYYVHGKNYETQELYSKLLLESDVLGDVSNPTPVYDQWNSSFSEWYFDDNYDFYTIETYSDEVTYETTYYLKCYPGYVADRFISGNIIFEAEDLPIRNIAVNNNYVYFDTYKTDVISGMETCAVARTDKSELLYPATKTQEELFVPYDGAKQFLEVTAIEVSSNDTVYLGVTHGGSDSPVVEILKYQKTNGAWSFVAAPIDLTLFTGDTTVHDSIKVVDLQLKGSRLYALVSLVTNGYSKGCLYAIDVSGNKFELGEPIGLLPVLSAMSDKVPENNNNQQFFYGPYKFVALKPDELVIAEDGIYKTGGQYGNANCIVNMKLENGIPTFTSRHNLKDINFTVEIDTNGCSF